MTGDYPRSLIIMYVINVGGTAHNFAAQGVTIPIQHFASLHVALLYPNGTLRCITITALCITLHHRYSTELNLAMLCRNYTLLHPTDTALYLTLLHPNGALRCITITTRRSTPPIQHCTSRNITVTTRNSTQLCFAILYVAPLHRHNTALH